MLIHCQMASEEQLDRMAKLGIIANFFVGHVHVWGDLHRDRFIGERALRMDPSPAPRSGICRSASTPTSR